MNPTAVVKKLAGIYRKAGYKVFERGFIEDKREDTPDGVRAWLIEVIYRPDPDQTGRIVGFIRVYPNPNGWVEISGWGKVRSLALAQQNKRELEEVLEAAGLGPLK